MSLIQINEKNKEIYTNIPLTTTSGKIRIKRRSMILDYGIPHASKQKEFLQNNYIEWQIGYDVVADDSEKLNLTTIPQHRFIAYNNKEKALYELSEYVYYLVKWQLISITQIEKIISFLQEIPVEHLIELHPRCQIKRTHPQNLEISNIIFEESKVEYPLLIHKFGKYEIIAEIIIREKQRAVGTQAMLYLCFPITELKSEIPLLGRLAKTKETAIFKIDKSNSDVFIEMLRVFGMLSISHNKDIVAILNLILKTAK